MIMRLFSRRMLLLWDYCWIFAKFCVKHRTKHRLYLAQLKQLHQPPIDLHLSLHSQLTLQLWCVLRYRLRLEVASSGDIRIGKKAKEIWVGYYFYVPNTPDNFKDKLLQPYITQFYSVNRKGGQTVGGYAPQFSASIYNGKLSIEGNHVIDEENLKGKWHKVEFNIRYSKQYDGFIKVYINDELKVNRSGFKTASHDYVDIKYGTYSHPEYGGASYPEGYQFPSHTIYFAGFSMNKDRSKLKISKK